MANLIKNRTVKARLRYKCGFCHGDINRGDMYHSSICADEGRAYTYRIHLDCQFIAEKLKMYDDPEGVDYNVFKEFILFEYVKITNGAAMVSYKIALDFVIDHYKGKLKKK